MRFYSVYYPPQGMVYIHNSKLSFHGRLKSPNCLVDNRWMLKVTDFGLAKFLDNSEDECDEEQQKYKGTYVPGVEEVVL